MLVGLVGVEVTGLNEAGVELWGFVRRGGSLGASDHHKTTLIEIMGTTKIARTKNCPKGKLPEWKLPDTFY